MSYTVQPVEFYALNDFIPKKEWEVQNSAVSLYFILQKTDQLGTRRFVPTAGSVLTVSFMRARAASVGSAPISVVKTATTVSADDKSFFKVDLSAAEAGNVISGTAMFTLTVSGTPTSFNVPYAVKKIMNGPGF